MIPNLTINFNSTYSKLSLKLKVVEYFIFISLILSNIKIDIYINSKKK